MFAVKRQISNVTKPVFAIVFPLPLYAKNVALTTTARNAVGKAKNSVTAMAENAFARVVLETQIAEVFARILENPKLNVIK